MGGAVPDPPAEERDTLVRQLRDDVEEELDTAALKHWCTPHCCLRYLRARKWKYDKALEMIQKTIKWRREWVPEEIRYDSLPLQMARGKVMVPRGNILDKFGRPIVYMEGRRDTPEAQKEGARPMIEHLVYWLEVACRQADASPEADGKMVWLINHTDYHTASNAPPLKVSLEILSILQNHYPERLGLAIMFNPPMSMSVFWNMVKPFVDPVTSQKVQFVSGRNPEKARNELSKWFEMSNLEWAVCGDADWYGRGSRDDKFGIDSQGYRDFYVKEEGETAKAIAKTAALYKDELSGKGGGRTPRDTLASDERPRGGCFCWGRRRSERSQREGTKHYAVAT